MIQAPKYALNSHKRKRSIIHFVPHHRLIFSPFSFAIVFGCILIRILGVELLLVRLHVDIALHLGTGRAELEAQRAAGGRLVEQLQAGHATVLHGVLEASCQVGYELVDGSGL